VHASRPAAIGRGVEVRSWWIAALAIGAVATVVYLNSLGGALLYDDTNAIINNGWVRAGDPFAILTHASWWSEGLGNGWRPVTTLTFAANHAIHGLEPFGYHLVNVILHACVSVLVFVVFARVTAMPLAAAIAGLLFAAHPVHTEAVASVVGRAELLAAAGFFCAWLLFSIADTRTGAAVANERETGSGAAAPGRARARLLEAAAVVVFFAALLAKENALALIPVLVVADVLGASSSEAHRRLRGHVARYVALGAAAVVFVVLRRLVLGPATGTISVLDNPIVELAPIPAIMTAIKVAGLYGWRLLVPWRLSADYSYRQIPPVDSALDPAFLGAMASFVVVAVLVWRARRAAPAVALGLAMLALTFAMVSNILFLIGTIMAERLIYLPSAGFCLAVGALLARVAAGASARYAVSKREPAVASRSPIAALATARLGIPLVLLVALYGARTWTRNAVWHDPVTFFSGMVADAPQSARSQREIGALFADLGKFDAARAAFDRSLAIRPNDAATLYNLGNAFVQEGRFDDAIATYHRALEAKPDFADALVNLGNAESLRGDHEAALTWMRRALALTPRSPSLRMNIANELFRLGSYPEARAEYEAALTLAPHSPDILTNYGAFLLSRGEHDAAAAAYRRAGDVPMALVGLGAAYRAKGMIAEARATLARATRLFPNNGAVRQLGEVLARDAAAGAGG
jgi:tetratricopeptide (TPR) repeat protein